jgi:hypothetical protein
MRHKRLAAAETRAAAKVRAAARVHRQEVAAARAQAAVAEDAHVLEVVPWLRPLGFKARESREAAELCRDMRGASLEERVRVALSYLRPRGTRKVRPWAGTGTTAPFTGVGAVATGP